MARTARRTARSGWNSLRWLVEGRAESRTPDPHGGRAGLNTLSLLQTARISHRPHAAIGAVRPGALPLRGTNRFATAGLVCSILAWVCCCCVPFNILGLAFSIIALVQISSQEQPQEGRVFAIIGLVLSGANLCFSLVLALLQMIVGSGGFDWSNG